MLFLYQTLAEPEKKAAPQKVFPIKNLFYSALGSIGYLKTRATGSDYRNLKRMEREIRKAGINYHTAIVVRKKARKNSIPAADERVKKRELQLRETIQKCEPKFERLDKKLPLELDRMKRVPEKTAPNPIFFPVEECTSFHFNYNEYRSKSRRHHNGLDLYATRWTKVVSPIDGEVVASKYSTPKRIRGRKSTTGNMITIKGTDGYFYFFCHLDKRVVKVGDKVKAGQKIGTVGISGMVGDVKKVKELINGKLRTRFKKYPPVAHLHYEIRRTEKLGSDVDPTDHTILSYYRTNFKL